MHDKHYLTSKEIEFYEMDMEAYCEFVAWAEKKYKIELPDDVNDLEPEHQIVAKKYLYGNAAAAKRFTEWSSEWEFESTPNDD